MSSNAYANNFKAKNEEKYVLGVDGARAGWIAVKLDTQSDTFSAILVPDFRSLFYQLGEAAEIVLVDMPIGLSAAGSRECERMARAVLSPKRHSSVFPSPARPMLDFETYEEANAWGKMQKPPRGLPKQTWMLMPKIREIDAVITPRDQHHLGEGHPELAFTRLNKGVPCNFSKKSKEGAAERLSLLRRHNMKVTPEFIRILKEKHGSGVNQDDILDACALALSAKARLNGNALCYSNNETDARGLKMEIWG